MQHAQRLILVVLALLPFGGAEVWGQGSACVKTALEDPARTAFRCKQVTIEVEAGSDPQLLDADRDGEPEGIKLDRGAVLVDYAPGATGSFQILTPYAIASVRGTTWIVDAPPERTSVFVLDGAVSVARIDALTEVVLQAGEGVDADAGTAPLQVKVWSAERAGKLLARFGR